MNRYGKCQDVHTKFNEQEMKSSLIKHRPVGISAAMVALSVAASPASAFTEYNKTISRLGVQGTSAYVYFVEGVTQNCNELYMNDSSSIKMLYAQLLAAKLSGTKIARLDYSISNGVCQVDLVQIN